MSQLTDLCSTGGCAAKYEGVKLDALLRALPPGLDPDLLVGIDPPDDAAVIRLDDDSGLVFTVDFFPPIVDDPTDFGRIAANNALNDVYAMGGQPILALSIAAFPADLSADSVAEIVRGAALQCAEAGAVLAGGHTIRDREPKFGLAVAGRIAPDQIWRKSGAKPGDVIVITKPIGSGILITARRQGAVSDESFGSTRRWMLASSETAAKLIAAHDPHAVTDLTGFGLAGHASEVTHLSDVRITIDMSEVPLLEEARTCADRGIRTTAHPANLTIVKDKLTMEPSVDDSTLALALDPQTAGGLMVAVPPGAADKLIHEFRRCDQLAARVGEVSEGTGVHLRGRA